MSNPSNGSISGVFLRAIVGGFMSTQFGYAVAPATINVADPAGLTDFNTSYLSINASGQLRVIVNAVSAGITFPTTPAILANSPGATARVVAPGAGVAIATIAAGSLPAGTYDVQVLAHYDVGAPVAAEINNMEFRRGATVVSSLSLLAIINVYSPVRIFRCVLDGATAVSVNATGAATAGVGYNAELVATRIA